MSSLIIILDSLYWVKEMCVISKAINELCLRSFINRKVDGVSWKSLLRQKSGHISESLDALLFYKGLESQTHSNSVINTMSRCLDAVM